MNNILQCKTAQLDRHIYKFTLQPVTSDRTTPVKFQGIHRNYAKTKANYVRMTQPQGWLKNHFGLSKVRFWHEFSVIQLQYVPLLKCLLIPAT